MLTYGFYNSYEHDRVYDAEQFAMMFDGLIADGVYAHIGQKFAVIEDSAHIPNRVIVQSGRAYFHHTWTYNDSNLVLNMDPPEVYLNRYDAVVIDIQDSNDVRENKIIFVKGTPSAYTDSQLVPKPTMINEGGHHQIPLAFIYRQANVNPESQVITTTDIWIVVGGTTYCPYVTGILETFSVTEHYARWAQDWENFKDQYESDYDAWVTRAEARYNDDTTALEQQWSNWVSSQESSFTAWREGQESDFNTWKTQQRNAFLAWMETQKDDFDDWFANLQYVLDGDVAGHLQNEIDEINMVTLNPLPISKGGTGNTAGYIRTGNWGSSVIGEKSTVEGYSNVAKGNYAHAEGYSTKANANYSHSEGSGSIVNSTSDGAYSNAEYAHAEGVNTNCYGRGSHAEGAWTEAGDIEANHDYSHAEGYYTHAKGESSHTEGNNTFANGQCAHAENGGDNYYETTQVENEFDSVRTTGDWERRQVVSVSGGGSAWYSLDITITASGKDYKYFYNPYWYLDVKNYSSERDRIRIRPYFYLYCSKDNNGTYINYLNGNNSSADAIHVKADMIYSLAQVEASGTASHAEGYGTRTQGIISHAEGEETSTTTNARASHAEGYRNIASGQYSHVEGSASISSGQASHAEGSHTEASGDYSHAEGFASEARGKYSHAGGVGGIAYREGQFVHGVVGFGGTTEEVYGGTETKFDNGANCGLNAKLHSANDSDGYGIAKIVTHKSTSTAIQLWLLVMANGSGSAKTYMVNSRGGAYAPIITQISSVGSGLPDVVASYDSTNNEALLTITNNTTYQVELQFMKLI